MSGRIPELLTLARLLIILGVILVITGGAVYWITKSGFQIGSLPGNLRLERGNFTCVIALGTSILLSIILTVLLNVIARWLNK